MRRPRRRLRGALLRLGGLVGLAALAAPVAVGFALTRLPGTRPQDRRLTATPFDHGLSYRTVFLEAGDGVRISGWLLRPSGPRGCAVVMAHGLFRSRQEVLKTAAWTAAAGCAVLALDLRRHGGSGELAGGEAARTSLGHYESLDVLAGAEFLRTRWPEARLYLFGISMGAAAAARAGVLAKEPPGGVVLDSVFRSVPAVVDQYAKLLLGLPPFPAGDLTLVGMRWSAGFRPREMDVEAFSRILGERGVPVLVLVGLEDRQALPAGQVEVFRANAHPRSRLLEVAGAGHGRPCTAGPAACREALRTFFALDGARSTPPAPRVSAYDPGS